MSCVQIKTLLIGIVCGAILVTVPSLMVSRQVYPLSVQEAVLRVVQLIACVVISSLLAKKRHLLSGVVFGYGFVFLYCALAMLCAKLNLSTFKNDMVPSIGLMFLLVGLAVAGNSYRTTSKVTRLAGILSATCGLAGISLIYNAWLPLLAIPGALVLIKVCSE